MKVVVAVDSFKGCMTSGMVNENVRLGILSLYPLVDIVKFPVSDGGEGFISAVTPYLKGKIMRCSVHDPLMRKIQGKYFLSEDGVAIIESAEACGLALLKYDERNPMYTTSFGVGELMSDAKKNGAREIIIGLGGSSTNDGGIGILQALGCDFYDSVGRRSGFGGGVLDSISYGDFSAAEVFFKGMKIKCACDVKNPFFGINGAAYVYAGQKGADKEMISRLDKGLRNVAGIFYKYSGTDISDIPGAGAAGGIGGMFVYVFGSSLRSGMDLYFELSGFRSVCSGSNLIITGEGKMDSQTFFGKVPYRVLRIGKELGIPVVAIAGSIDSGIDFSSFSKVININEGGFCKDVSGLMNPGIASENIIYSMRKLSEYF